MREANDEEISRMSAKNFYLWKFKIYVRVGEADDKFIILVVAY